MAEKKLNPKRQKFLSEYMKTGNGTEAARKAGYTGTDKSLGVTASRLLKNASVSKARERAQAKRSERLQLEEDFELKKAIELLRMCMEPHLICNMKGEPAKNGDGNFVFSFDSRGANTALQTIAKLRGKFVQKVDVSGSLDLGTEIAEALGRVKHGD